MFYTGSHDLPSLPSSLVKIPQSLSLLLSELLLLSLKQSNDNCIFKGKENVEQTYA